MKRKLFTAILLLLIFQLLNCASIYRLIRERRDSKYKEGVELYKQDKFAEANNCFKTVVDIEPDYKYAKSYLKKTERLLALKVRKIKRESIINYKKGVYWMKRGRYDYALKFMLLSQEQDPNNIDVDEKIDECRDKLAPEFDKMLKRAELQFQRKRYITAYITCIKAKPMAKPYTASGFQISSIMNKIESKLENNAEKFVKKGKQFYNKNQYSAARTQMRLAIRANPWDKSSKELLDKINVQLNLNNYYWRGIALYNKANYFGAKRIFYQVNAASPGYKAVNAYITKTNAALAGQVGNFYNNGVSYYNKGSYGAAIAEFNNVLAINPSHSKAKEYRERAQSKIEIEQSFDK